MIEAATRGFDNCFLDMLGNVAELGTANIFMVKTALFTRRCRTERFSTALRASV